MQKRGVVSAPILTAPFREVLARHLAYWQPDGEMPVLLVGHPIQNVPDEALDARAQELVDAVQALLP